MKNEKIVFIPIKLNTLRNLQKIFDSKNCTTDNFDEFLNQVINYGQTIEKLNQLGRIDADILNDITNENLISTKEVCLN
jgi:hypothetical protein